MTPEMRFAITAQDRSSGVLKQVGAEIVDLKAKAEAAGTSFSHFGNKVSEGARLSGAQVAELGHVVRSVSGTLLAGGSAMQAFGYEANRIVSILTIGEGGVGGTLKA